MINFFNDMSLGMKPIFFSNDPVAPDPRRVGNKAANLWRLARSGLRVPCWFVITQDAFASLLSAHGVDIEKLIEGVGVAGVRKGFEKRLLAVAGMTLQTLMEKEVAGYFDSCPFFSVRSSAIEEDAKEASFAGILDSYLFVRREDLLDRIVRCAGSAVSERAVAYLEARGFPHRYVRTAVIIQEMIHSKKSGVLFTRDPVSETNACVITAGFGVGEGVVANLVGTDTIWMDPHTGEIIRAQIGVKRSRITVSANRQEGPILSSIPETTAPVLTLEDLQALFQLMKRVEGIFGEPQDVEWAFDSEGRLHLLQARPITSFRGRPEKVTVWDNSNIVESYPGVTTPLTYSFVRHVYERVMKKTAIGITRRPKTIEENSVIFETLVGYLDGRIYYNLTNWYSMVSLFPFLSRDKTACNRMLGIRSKGVAGESSARVSYRSYGALFWKFCFRRYYRRCFYREFDKLYSTFTSLDFDSFTPFELYNLFKKLAAVLLKIWPTTIENDLFLILFHEFLIRFLRKAGLADQAVNFQKLAHHSHADMESVKPLQALTNIARIIRDNPSLISLFRLNEQEILQCLGDTPAFGHIHEAIQEYINKYGDRTPHELKLETRSMRDDPAILIRLIKSVLPHEENSAQKPEKDEEDSWERSILKGIGKNPFRWLIFHLILNGSREATKHRENMRFARTRAYGLVKRIFRAIGRSFYDLSLLESIDDIYFLTMEEIFALITGAAVNVDLRPTVQIRKERFRLQEQSPTPPSRLFTQGLAAVSPLHSNASGETWIAEDVSELRGIGCSPGKVTGRARILKKPEPSLSVNGEILVAEMTDPGWIFLMMTARGIIVERGSLLSHTAIIGRELGIPTITGMPRATERINDGELITMDGSTGVITKLNATTGADDRSVEIEDPCVVIEELSSALGG